MKCEPQTLSRPLRRGILAIGFAGIVFLLGGCVTGGTDPGEGIGFREARYTEMVAVRGYRDCRDQALQMDRAARSAGDPARYLASAQLLEKCESGLGPEAAQLAKEERMRAYALASQNYLKGGDVAGAQRTLETFKTRFAGADLYLADGSSFTATMELLAGLRDRTDVGEFSVMNAGGPVKAELRRSRYWQQN
jgi:hypothetical protein